MKNSSRGSCVLSHFLFLSVFVYGGLTGCSQSGGESPANQKKLDSTSSAVSLSAFKPVTTEHHVTIHGQGVAYSATVDRIEVVLDTAPFAAAFNPAGPQAPTTTPTPSTSPLPKGFIYFTYYKNHSDSSSNRPLTFAFNGGPGSASLWLHLGALGPKRVQMGPDGLHPALPFQLEDNPDSPLDTTDIVMIDPIGTGFSHAEDGSTNDEFFGTQNDAISIALFIRGFLDKFNRRASPLYLLGESYGGIRGSIVAQLLESPLYLPLKGLILFSPWLSSTTTNFGEDDNIVPYFTYFPSFATSAWYHKTAASNYLSQDVATVYQEASSFSLGAYRDALEAGNSISTGELQTVAAQITQFTGISQDWVERNALRIRDVDFFGQLLLSENLMVGRYDSRFTGRRLLKQDGTSANDPSDIGTGFPFVSAINSYFRNDLQFQTDAVYIDSATISNWPYNSDGSELIATHNLSQAFADNPDLQVFVASGYYDLACPMGTVDFEHSMLDPASRGKNRFTVHRYESGHMMYINPVVLNQLTSDLGEFYHAGSEKLAAQSQ